MLLVSYAGACAMAGLALESAPESISLLIYFLLFLSHCVFVLKSGKISAFINGKTVEA